MEVLGRPVWVNFQGVPAHSWNEEIFKLLGNCLGRTILVDPKTTLKEDLEVGKVMVILERSESLPTSLSLWVNDIIFQVRVTAEASNALDREVLDGSERGRLSALEDSRSRQMGKGSVGKMMTSVMRQA